MKKQFLIILVVASAIAVTVLFSSCGLFKQTLAVQGDATMIFNEGEVYVSVTFLDDATILKRFGPQERNPFLTPYFPMMFRRIMPFEVKIINYSDSNLEISTQTCNLLFEGVKVSAYNKFMLQDFWERRDEADDIHPTDHSDKISTLNKYQMDTWETIGAKASFSKILTFVGDSPDFGTAKMTILLRDKVDPRNEKRIEFEYKF
ncbi:MAG: hypothetical protein EHM28_07575 [Spirochaetaceae bacterium]|nr:MAG: hypothetical protein EHM28_07575 [Spirochaetaceae bacterium]